MNKKRNVFLILGLLISFGIFLTPRLMYATHEASSEISHTMYVVGTLLALIAVLATVITYFVLMRDKQE
jgi:H+/Cl- antiporter ClcA